MAKKKRNTGPAQPRKNGPQNPAPTGRLAAHRPLYERLLFVLALLGVLVTVHLNIWYGANAAPDDPVCGAGFDCTAVLAEDPAPLGIPSAVWGLLFYLGIGAVCAAIVFMGAERRVLLKKARVVMIGLGFLYSVFLTAYQFFGLQDRCLLCLLSALVVTLMAVVQGLYLFQPAPEGRARQASAAPAEAKLYGGLAVLLILLAGGDYLYYGSQVPATAAVAAMPVAEDGPVDVSACRYDPERPYYSNFDRLISDADPVIGNPDAPVTIIEYLDPNCPHCKTVYPVMKAIAAKYPEQVRVVYKPVALVGSATHSLDEVMALYLAEEAGKFAEMMEYQFVNQSPRTGLSIDQLADHAETLGMDPRAFREAIADGRFNQEIRRSRQVFDGLGLRGVPAVILEGRVVHSRSRSVGCLSHFIEQELEEKGVLEEEAPPVEEAAAQNE